MRTLGIMIGTAAALLAGAGPPADADLVQRALEATDGGSVRGWAYTETAVENGRETVTTFDPRRPDAERWHLVSVDGRPPTDAEREKEAQRRSADEDPDTGTGSEDDDEIGGMIKPGSLSLVEDTGTHAVYRFEPVSDDEDDAKIYENLEANLKIVKDGPYVESVDMRSRGPFKPGFGVKISEFVMAMTFEPAAAGGPLLPRTVTVRLNGRALLFKKIKEKVKVTYSGYEYVGE